jgi:hypothetical protein
MAIDPKHLEDSIKDRLSEASAEETIDGDEIDVVGATTFRDIARFVANGVPRDQISKSVEGGADIDLATAVGLLIGLIGAAKNLWDIYDKIQKARSRKPTADEFEKAARESGEKDAKLIVIVYRRAAALPSGPQINQTKEN